MKTLEMLNGTELNLNELKNITGGGDPIPGADIYLEQEPHGEPIVSGGNKSGFAVGGYNSNFIRP
jgi:hypothetical protein